MPPLEGQHDRGSAAPSPVADHRSTGSCFVADFCRPPQRRRRLPPERRRRRVAVAPPPVPARAAAGGRQGGGGRGGPAAAPEVLPPLVVTPHSPLADAAMKRDTAAVRALVEQKVDVNAPGRDGTPAAALAGSRRRSGFGAAADPCRRRRHAREPLRRDAAVSGVRQRQRGDDPAAARCRRGSQRGRSDRRNAADDRVAESANLDAVTLLLDRGAVVDAKDPEFQQTALMVAVRENHPDVVRLLVERHADVNAKTRTGRDAAVDPAEFGARVRTRHRHRSRRPAGSRIALSDSRRPDAAAVCRPRRPARCRADAGRRRSRPRTRPIANGITPLLMAITNNHMDVARFLIDAGRRRQRRRLVRTHAAVGGRRNAQHGRGQRQRSKTASIARPALELIKLLLDQGRRPEHADEGNAADPPADAARHRLAGVGGFHRTDAVPDGVAGRRSHRDASAARLRRRSRTSRRSAAPRALMAAAGINWVVDQTFDEGPEGAARGGEAVRRARAWT